MKHPAWTTLCRHFVSFASICLVWTGACTAQAAHLGFNNEGVTIDAGSMGNFTLEYPTFETANGKPMAIIQKAPAGKTATIKYDGGAVVQVVISDSGEIDYNFVTQPTGVKNWKTGTLIDFSYQQGGKWKLGTKEGNFPAEKPSNPHLFGGNTTTFQLTNAEGKTLALQAPEYSYLELTDNREWHWSIYALKIHTPYDPYKKTYKIMVSDQGSGATVKLVDPFGQTKSGDWPGKVKSADELKADVKADEEYYAGLNPPAGDKFDGLPGSREKLGLTASGFFHVEKKDDKWILVDPEGNAFFQLGVCCLAPGDDYTTVGGRESIYEWLPDPKAEFATAFLPKMNGSVLSFYLTNIIRKFGKPYDLADLQARMIDRLRKLGFNSIGAFSPVSPAVHAANFPYVSHLPLGEWGEGSVKGISTIPGINGTWDPFDEGNRAKVDGNFATLAAKANDPLLIGYFLTNEPLYEDIPKVVPGLKGSVFACKRALVALLAEKYKSIEAFNKAWGASAVSFDELKDAALAVNTKEAAEDVHDFTGQFFETYYKLVADTFHKYDPHHMLIGNRFQPGTINNEQLCRIAGKYLDIMSYNYYTTAVDRDSLKRIYQWTGGRPMLLSEFYWSAPKESGLVGGNELNTQQERGRAYRNYIDQSASLGFVVGIEWFTLIDQASTGRWFSKYSGERANTGLFSVADRPYKPMLAEMMKANYGVYSVWLNGKVPFAFDNPKFSQATGGRTASIPHATGPIKVDGTTKNWPGIPPEIIGAKGLVTGSEAGGVEGTFKLCWDENNLYVLATVIDPTPMKSDGAPDHLWSGDCVELFLGSEKLDEGGQLLFTDRHLLIGIPGAGRAPFLYTNSPQQYACDALIVPGGDGKSYTLEAAVPWEALGVKPAAGVELRFDLGIDDSTNGTSRRAQLMWNGTDKNSGDRTHWGRARLLP